MDPLLSSSMWQASFKCETLQLELKSSRSFLAIKCCQRTKSKKVLKQSRSSINKLGHICATSGKAVNGAIWCHFHENKDLTFMRDVKFLINHFWSVHLLQFLTWMAYNVRFLTSLRDIRYFTSLRDKNGCQNVSSICHMSVSGATHQWKQIQCVCVSL